MKVVIVHGGSSTVGVVLINGDEDLSELEKLCINLEYSMEVTSTDTLEDLIGLLREEAAEHEAELEADRVPCRFCSKAVSPLHAHLHINQWICDGCWDERFRTTE